MTQPVKLEGNGTPQKISRYYECHLQAPGLLGQVREIDPAGDETRAGGLKEESLQKAIKNSEMQTNFIFEIEITADRLPPEPDSATRADGLTATTPEGEAAIPLTLPAAGDNVGYAMLYTDEAGISRWIFPQDGAAGGEVSRGSGDPVIFNLPRANAPLPSDTGEEEEAGRGPYAKIGRRVVRVLTWVTDGIIGKTALKFITSWEEANRPYKILAVKPGQFQNKVNWEQISGGRTLLLIHGTFSTAEASFGGMFEHDFKSLAAHYGQRVIAFNYPSLHHTPTQNAQKFLAMLPENISLEVDIVTHSRGGLVAREFTERLTGLETGGRKIKIGKVLFVAAPHRGTILTDEKNGLDLIDRYTNFLTNLPDEAFLITIEAILALVKLVGHGTLKGLPGLQSMNPQGDYLKALNAHPVNQADYYALAADFTPTAPGLIARLGKTGLDTFVDRLFEEANDSVVPTGGCHQIKQTAAGFPIPAERYRVYAGTNRIHHCNFFEQAIVNRQISEWLTAN